MSEGIALLAHLLKRSAAAPAAASAWTFSSKSTLSHGGLLSATITASIAGFSASCALIRDGGIPVALCDAGAEWSDSYAPDLSEDALTETDAHVENVNYNTKEYYIKMKPLFSAFEPRTLTLTSLRSFLMFYLPLLESKLSANENDDFEDDAECEPLDLVAPFKKSIKQITLETSITTTRRVLERIAVHYVSQRMAWKLLKDVPQSAKRKAGRQMPALCFIYSVGTTTFRGHLLGVAASWLVQIGIDVYCFLFKKRNEEEFDRAKKVKVIGKRVFYITVRCFGSLVFASVGGGIGAIFHPSIGQRIGCALGDFAGPELLQFVLNNYLL